MKKSNWRHIFLKAILYSLLTVAFLVSLSLFYYKGMDWLNLTFLFDDLVLAKDFFGLHLGISNILSAILTILIAIIFSLPFIFLAQIIHSLNFYEKKIIDSLLLPVGGVVLRWFYWIKSHAVLLYKISIITVAVYLHFQYFGVPDSSVDFFTAIVNIGNIVIIYLLAILLMIAVSSRKN